MGREYKLRRTPSVSPVPAEGTAKTSPLDSSLEQRQKTTRQSGRGNCVDGAGWFSRCTVADSAKGDLKQCRLTVCSCDSAGSLLCGSVTAPYWLGCAR